MILTIARSLEGQEDCPYRSEDDDSGDEGEPGSNSSTAMKISVPIAELESRARELDIHNIGPFFDTVLFRSNRFSIEGDMITRCF